jgi:hypothetical protein
MTIPAARHSTRDARRARADKAAADLAPVIAELRAAGVTRYGASQRSSTSGASPPWLGPVVGITRKWGACWHGWRRNARALN